MRLVLAFALLLSAVAFAQEGGKKHPIPVPKNLKVLTGMNGAQVIQVMRGFDAALGVHCEHCHVGEEDFANDANPSKGTGRMMIVMTREINAKFPDGKEHVSCYTCHRGATEPATAPPAAASSAKP